MNDQKKIEMLINSLSAILTLTEESDGVAGYHLNGEVAKWEEFEEVQDAYDLLSELIGV